MPFSTASRIWGGGCRFSIRVSLKSLEHVSSLERMSKTFIKENWKNQTQKSYFP
jgi:hypothetical protein